MSSKRAWGIVDKLPSGNWRARYTHNGKRYSAPTTFRTKRLADAFLARTRAEIESGQWMTSEERAEQEAQREAAKQAEAAKQVPFGTYATRWVEQRTNSRGEPLKPTSKAEYKRYLDTGKLAVWKNVPIPSITPADVRDWYASEQQDGHLTSLAKQYDFMKSVLKTAVEDGLIPTNPCTVKGGSRASTGKEVIPPTDDELDVILATLPEKYRVIATIAAAGGLRKGEILALNREDVIITRKDDDTVDSVQILVTKSLAEPKGGGQRIVLKPKTKASVRPVIIFGKDAQTIADYVEDKEPGKPIWTDQDGVGHMPLSTLQYPWEKAREAAGRPDLPFHALRHYQGTRFAQTGATLAEIMDRLGHSDVKAAMRYQHAGTRAEELARKAARM